MELILMLCLLGMSVLLTCWLVLVLLSSLAGRVARRLTADGGHALRWEKRAKLGTMAFLLLTIGALLGRALFPADGVYLEQFSQVSLRAPPASARVVDKSAPYFDFQGDACSYSKIELSRADYNTLLAQLEADTRLRSGTDLAGEGLRSPKKRSFTRQLPHTDERHLSLQFLGDGRNVEVNICLS
ncbi:MAG TPA: hypothetical protein VGC21_22355 [Telluria sp.]|jgi:hypothetical protein